MLEQHSIFVPIHLLCYIDSRQRGDTGRNEERIALLFVQGFSSVSVGLAQSLLKLSNQA